MRMDQNVTVDKGELLKILRENRNLHREVFEAACEGYRNKAIELLDGYLKELRAGHRPQIAIHLPPPEDHTPDYDRVIRMYEMHLEDKIELDEETFSAYVMDDWSWKRQFLATNSSYAAGAVRKAYGN